jgi:hypothetical protein
MNDELNTPVSDPDGIRRYWLASANPQERAHMDVD